MRAALSREAPRETAPMGGFFMPGECTQAGRPAACSDAKNRPGQGLAPL